MGIAIDNKLLLDIYLESHNEDDLFNLMKSVEITINKAVGTFLKNNNISKDRYDEFKNIAYLNVYTKILKIKVYNGSTQDFNSLIWKWTSRAIVANLKIEQIIEDNEISLEEFDDDYFLLEKNGLVCDFEGKMGQEFTDLEMRKIMVDSFKKLTSLQKKMIYLYFGFGDGKPKSMEEVGKITGCSRKYVSECIMRALERIRKHIYSRKKTSSVFDEEYKNAVKKKWTYKK